MATMTETTFSDAAAMLDACRQELEKRSFRSQAKALRGLEVFDAADARVALLALQELSIADNDYADDLKRYAADALHQAILCDVMVG